MTAPHVFRTEDEMFAAITAGHEMAGIAMSVDGEAAARRIVRGEATADEEIAVLRDRVTGPGGAVNHVRRNIHERQVRR